MMSLWYIYALVAVLFVIFLVIVAIGFSRSGTGHDDTQRKRHARELQHP